MAGLTVVFAALTVVFAARTVAFAALTVAFAGRLRTARSVASPRIPCA